MLVFCHDSDPAGEACLETVQNVAQEYRGKFIFITVSHQELHLYHLFGIKVGSAHPQIVILNITNEHDLKRYVLDEDAFTLMESKKPTLDEGKKKVATSSLLTEERLRLFLGMYLAGEIKPFYRSEESTQTTTDDGAEQVVSSSEGGIEGETDAERLAKEELLPTRVTSLTLREKVIDNTESVLLFITAPW